MVFQRARSLTSREPVGGAPEWGRFMPLVSGHEERSPLQLRMSGVPGVRVSIAQLDALVPGTCCMIVVL